MPASGSIQTVGNSANVLRKFWMATRSLFAEVAAFPVWIRRTNCKLIVIADLPGLKKEEIKVELTDDVMVIDALPNREREASFRRAGRRIVPLPYGAEVACASAQLRDGILTVSLPIKSARHGCTVPVDEIGLESGALSLSNDQYAKV